MSKKNFLRHLNELAKDALGSNLGRKQHQAVNLEANHLIDDFYVERGK